MTATATKASTAAEITEVPPSRLVVMLYDGAIASLEAAIEAIEKGEIERRCNMVNMAVEILSFLYLSLDMERGGVISENLGRLYRYMLARLQRVNPDNDAEPAREAVRLLKPLLKSWRSLDADIAEASERGEIHPALQAARATIEDAHPSSERSKRSAPPRRAVDSDAAA